MIHDRYVYGTKHSDGSSLSETEGLLSGETRSGISSKSRADAQRVACWYHISDESLDGVKLGGGHAMGCQR